MVMGRDSCSRLCGFECHHQILDRYFSHYFLFTVLFTILSLPALVGAITILLLH